jgi:hypothetical protein
MLYGTLNLFPVPLNCSYRGNDPLHSHSLFLPAVLMDKITESYSSRQNSYVNQ